MIHSLHAYCSWCFQESHHSLMESNVFRRNIYKCHHCKKKTLSCRAISCHHMAKAGDKWDEEFCAEHDGSLPSFKNQKMKLDKLTDYHHLFKRESTNMVKVARVTALTIGGAVALGPLALAAAPAIGGAVGTGLLGLSGAAATNGGLAAIGGGALSVGGLGMAGGAAIIGAAGGAIGSAVGLVVANSYFSDINGFEIIEQKVGKEPYIILVDGFLTQKVETPDDWLAQISEKYPKNGIYYLKWESKVLLDIGSKFGGALGRAAAEEAMKQLALKAAKKAAANLTPIGKALQALSMTNNPWHVAMLKSAQTGIVLSEIIARTNHKYILMGHSLGARVIYYALRQLETKSQVFIETVHLLGGAVSSDKTEWEKPINGVIGTIYNYHSKNDWVLKGLYNAGNFFIGAAPIGYNPIQGKLSKIKNIDVSEHVTGHTKCKDNFKKYIIG